MPIYEFSCDSCGPFETWLEMKHATASMSCPSCNAISERIFSPPRLIKTSYSVRRRIERCGEPRVIRRPHREESVQKQKHHKRQSKGRPWMIGH